MESFPVFQQEDAVMEIWVCHNQHVEMTFAVIAIQNFASVMVKSFPPVGRELLNFVLLDGDSED